MEGIERERILSKLVEPMPTRKSIVDNWHAQIKMGIPIIYAGCSAGIVAKYAEWTALDAIVVYETGLSRHWGMPTTMLADPNRFSFPMYEEIRSQVDRTPLIAGVECYDPRFRGERGLRRMVKTVIGMGYDGIQNFPTLVFLEPNTRITPIKSIDAACKHVQEITDAAREINPKIISLSHGGPFIDIESVKYMFEHTTTDGFEAASAWERVPVENALTDILVKFRAVKKK